MSIPLSSSELSNLTQMYKKEKDKTVANRINIILLSHKGYSGVEISNILNVDQDTITKWLKLYMGRKDDTSWLNVNNKPYLGKLSYCSISQIRSYISSFLVGNKKEIQSFIKNSFSVFYTLSGVNKLLNRIDLSHQTIHKLPGRCPINEQQSWIDQFNQKLQSTDFKTETILFMDSVHPTHNTTYSKVWTFRGIPRWIKSNTGRNRINISGTYDVVSQKAVVSDDVTVNGKSVIKLLKKCLVEYKDKETITVYLDNASYHRSIEVKEFLAKNDKIVFSFLPPYSPNLNLIERLWKFTNEKIINLKYYPDFKEFKECVMEFYENIGQYSEELKGRINFNFQTFEGVQT